MKSHKKYNPNAQFRLVVEQLEPRTVLSAAMFSAAPLARRQSESTAQENVSTVEINSRTQRQQAFVHAGDIDLSQSLFRHRAVASNTETLTTSEDLDQPERAFSFFGTFGNAFER